MKEPGKIEHSTLNEPKWLRRLKRSSIFAVAVAIGILIGQALDLFEGIGKIYDRFKKPEAFVLAEDSAKSIFSDQFAQRAWRRLFWADNFVARVDAPAPLGDIDASWQKYIEADADWNANILISIVGVERYYGAKRSDELEGPIQDHFANLDARLAAIRQSRAIEAMRSSKSVTPGESDYVKALVGLARKDSDGLKQELYILVRCFSPTERDKNLCR